MWRTCPLAGGAVGAWRCGRIPFAGVTCSGLRWLRLIWGGVAWGGRASAGLGLAGGRVGAGPWLPVGVGWPGGRHSRRSTGSGLQRKSCRGKRGGRCGCCAAGRCTAEWLTRAGRGVLAPLFPVTSYPWGVVCWACMPGLPGAGFRSWGSPVGSSGVLWGFSCVACW